MTHVNLEYLLRRDVRLHALVLAYMRVLERQAGERPKRRPARRDERRMRPEGTR